MHQEVVEAEGHLIDSHLMERIFDTVVEYNGKFEVEEFRIGRTNAEASYLRMRVETGGPEDMEKLVSQLLGLGCTPIASGDVTTSPVERDCCAPEDFYSTTNHHTQVRYGGKWIDADSQRMDATIVLADGRAVDRRAPDCGAQRAGARGRKKSCGGGRTRGGAYRRSCSAGGADPRRMGAGAA